MDPRSPGGADHRPVPEYPGSLLWSGGILLLAAVGGFSFRLSALADSIPWRSWPSPAELGHSVLPMVIVTGVFYGVYRMFRAADLHHPLAAALLVAAAAGAAHVQLVLLMERADFGLGSIILVFTHQGASTVLGGAAVLAVLHRTRGSLPGILWACVALVAVVLLRSWFDEATADARQEQTDSAHRARFDHVVADLTGDWPPLLVLESPGWTVENTEGSSIIYVRDDDGAVIRLDSWGPVEMDPYRSEPDYPGPMRSGCAEEYTECEDFASDGVNGVVFRSPEESFAGYVVRVAVEPEPGSEVHADLFVYDGSTWDIPEEEVIALVHDLRGFEEGDAERLAEEITGGPRP
ncbi:MULTISPECIES: hypothetical protein [unclassified Nocardiopsis]|uniref:hypothetical protein n=1 Tax=Nocardiopsis TaxID=2013 RepID=UPI00387B829A